jgi:hypothetical protein
LAFGTLRFGAVDFKISYANRQPPTANRQPPKNKTKKK